MQVRFDLDAYRKLPWWWTYIFSLLNLCENRESLASVSADGKPPPREIWLDDAELQAWKADQKAMKEDMRNQERMGR